MACAPKKHRGNLRGIIKQLLNDCNSKTSQLLEHIPESFHISCEVAQAMENLHISENNEDNDQNISNGEFEISSVSDGEQMIGVGEDTLCLDDDNVEVIDSCEYEIEDSAEETEDSQINDSNIHDLSTLNDTRSKNELPEWVTHKFRLALVSPTIVNIHNFKRIFIPSQSEDYLSPPSHLIIFPILQIVIGMVLGKKRSTEVKCHARLRSTITGIYKLTPVFSTDTLTEMPDLESIESMNSSTRRTVLLKCLNIENANLSSFSEEWKLFVIAVLYWVNNCETMKLDQTYIRSVILCLIYLSVIDQKIGYTRSQSELNRLNNLEKKKKNESTIESSVEENSEAENSLKFDDLGDYQLNIVTQVLDIVSQKDCILAATALLHYHQLDNNLLQNRKSFDTKLVHSFAQLQHCIQAVTLLNSVLDFPYEPCMVHQVFSGTFLYNFYNDMCKRKLADGYITRTLLSRATSVISLYRYLIKSIAQVIPSISETGSSNAEKKKKKSKRKKILVPVVQNKLVQEPEESFVDSENIYSMLPTTDCNR